MKTNIVIRVVLYDDIIKSNNIDDVFNGNNKLIIFYPALQIKNTTMGHYCCITKLNDVIYFYDPLGYKIDEYKKKTIGRGNLYREQYNSLIKLLLQSPYKVDYNIKQHQSRKPDVSTCGRHCILRCMNANMTNYEYDRALRKLAKQMGLKDKLFDKLVIQFI